MTTEWKPKDAVDGRGQSLLRIREVAERLSVSPSMAWKLTATGYLPLLQHVPVVLEMRTMDECPSGS